MSNDESGGRLWPNAPVFRSTRPRNKVTAFSIRHSGNLLAGIQKYSLDTGLRRYDEMRLDTLLR